MNYAKTVICLVLFIAAISCAQPKDSPKTYPGAEVASVNGVDGVYLFRCDVKGWPAIIGENIGVRIASIEPPAIVAQEDGANKFFELQAKKFLSGILSKAKKIELKNVRRGSDFTLLADVIVDSNSLAGILIDQQLAKPAVKKVTRKELIKKRQLEKQTKPALPDAQKTAAASGQKHPVSNIQTGWFASKNSKVFHNSTCRHAKGMTPENAIRFPTRDHAINTGRRPCKTCKP